MSRFFATVPRLASRRLRIAALVLFGLVLAHGPANSQATQLPAVAITASREPLALERIVADLVVIDAARIRTSGADSIEDLLQREGGIQLSRNGAAGQSAAILMRGAFAGQTVVLVDGVRIGSASLGQVDLAGLSLAQVERIEILRGPGSSLYGADAIGGVVQIVTRRGGATPALAAHVAIGGLRSREASFAVDGRIGDFDLAAAASHESSSGVSAIKPGDLFGLHNPDRDGFERTSAHVRAGFAPATGHRIGLNLLRSHLNAQFDGADFLPPNFVANPSADFRNRFDVQMHAVDYRLVLSERWTSSVQWSRQRDDLTSGGVELSRYTTQRRVFTWQNAWNSADGRQLVAALERQAEEVRATPYTKRNDNAAIVLAYSAARGAHRWQADLRGDHNSAFGSVRTGKLGWAWAIAPSWTLRAVAGTAYRAPAFNDLYFPGYGVARLQPERSRSVEAGLQWRAGAGAAALTLYRNRVRDLIGYEPDRSFCPADPAYDFGCARNIRRARLQGATVTTARRIGELDLRAAIDFLDAKDEASGQRLARRAAHQESLGLEWTRDAWSLSVALLDVGARPEGGATLAAYQTLNLQARLRLAPGWRLEAKLLNATDRAYEPARDYQASGRQAWIGVRYDGREPYR